jgi:hypothetical protein
MVKKIFLILAMVVAPAVTALAADQSTGLIFTGKIEELALKTSMLTELGKAERYLSIKLDNKPKGDFRIKTKDAARFGLIENTEPSAVLTPGKVRGVGWKVRLTCNKKLTLGEPIYLVTSLERLD